MNWIIALWTGNKSSSTKQFPPLLFYSMSLTSIGLNSDWKMNVFYFFLFCFFKKLKPHQCRKNLFHFILFWRVLWLQAFFFFLLLENLLKWVVPTGVPLLNPRSAPWTAQSVARHGGFVLPCGDLHSQPPIKTILPFYGDNTLCPQEGEGGRARVVKEQ